MGRDERKQEREEDNTGGDKPQNKRDIHKQEGEWLQDDMK